MTDNIVARLRGPYEWLTCRQFQHTDMATGDDAPFEAADEIERLREEIQELKKNSTIFIIERGDAISQNADLREENAELRDSIERLRAALREISKLEPDGCLSTDSLTVVYAVETARAALAGEHIADAGKKVATQEAPTALAGEKKNG